MNTKIGIKYMKPEAESLSFEIEATYQQNINEKSSGTIRNG